LGHRVQVFPMSLDAPGLPFALRYKQAAKTGVLSLSCTGISRIPPEVFQMTELNRLDLGHNEITEIPDEISNLLKLEQLWINGNPLRELPASLCKCAKLKVIDARETELTDLPRELGRLKQLVEFDLREAPLVPKRAMRAHSVEQLIAHLAHKDTRLKLKVRLEEAMCEGVYREISDDPDSRALIRRLVLACFVQFKADNAEVKSLIRNCDRLFPEKLDEPHGGRRSTWDGAKVGALAADIRAQFIVIKRDNERKRMAAELEIQMRCIYYDAIDPQRVEGIVKAIYELVGELDDVRFLIKHAASLFPPTSEEVTGPLIARNIREMQERLARERAAAIAQLLKALANLYPDTEPVEVAALCEAVVALFKATEDIKNLAADVAIHFPPDFLDATDAGPVAVKKSFVHAKKNPLGDK